MKLSRLADLTEPTHENLRKLAATLAESLRRQLRQNGIDPHRAIGFNVDSQTGQVDINASRPDAQEISTLLESQPALGRQIRDVAALGKQVLRSEQDALSSQIRQATLRAARIESFAADYASRIDKGGEPGDFSRIANPRGANAAGLRRCIATYSAVSAAGNTVSLLYNGADVQVRS